MVTKPRHLSIHSVNTYVRITISFKNALGDPYTDLTVKNVQKHPQGHNIQHVLYFYWHSSESVSSNIATFKFYSI